VGVESLRKVLVERRRWSAYLLTFDHSEALGAVLAIEDELDPKGYWQMVRDAWIATESVAANEQTWRRLFSSDRPGREKLTSDRDRPVLEGLPEEVTVYRGHSHEGGEHGLAWTLERDSAEKFARQFARSTDLGHPPGEPRIATATVPRSSIVAVFQDRRPGDLLILDQPSEVHVEML
jgi:hypothetical protein